MTRPWADILRDVTAELLARECTLRESILYGGDEAGTLGELDAHQTLALRHLERHAAAEAEMVKRNANRDKYSCSKRAKAQAACWELRHSTTQLAAIYGVAMEADDAQVAK